VSTYLYKSTVFSIKILKNLAFIFAETPLPAQAPVEQPVTRQPAAQPAKPQRRKIANPQPPLKVSEK
jgi:hypothetical protein